MIELNEVNLKTTIVTIHNIDFRVTYQWDAFIQDVIIKKIIVPIGSTLDYPALHKEVLEIELARTKDRREFNEEMREEEQRYPDESDPMIDGVE